MSTYRDFVNHKPQVVSGSEARPVDESTSTRLRQIWNQSAIPVLYRRGPGNPLLARLPWQPDNRAWLHAIGRKHPAWVASERHWELPQAWFEKLAGKCLDKSGRVYIIQPYREQEKCAPACWSAQGETCECSCMGVNHGANGSGSGWKIVSDAFATRWGPRHLACRLLTRSR